ncbi:MAG: ABC transporter permease subunit [Pirellulales bacterium]
MAETPRSAEERKSFTGRARRHRNRWAVQFADAAAKWLITIGGIGTIVAVLLVFVFLLSVALPLFWPRASLTLESTASLAAHSKPLAFSVNEYRTLAWLLDADGRLRIVRTDDGALLAERPFLEEGRVTAAAYQPATGDLALGLEDGAVRLGSIRFSATFREPDEFDEALRRAVAAGPQTFEEGIIEATTQGQFRVQSVTAELGPTIEFETPAPIVALDLLGGAADGGSRGPVILAAAANGQIHLATTKFNEFTGQHKVDEQTTFPRAVGVPESPPQAVHVAGRGDRCYAVWPDGVAAHFDARDLSDVKLIETLDVLEPTDRRVTASGMTLGRETLVIGDSQGGLKAWFPVRRESASGETQRLELAHPLPAGPAAVATLAASQRSRLLSVGFANGAVGVYHVTTEQQLVLRGAPATGATSAAEAALFVEFTPKDDGLVTVGEDQIKRYQFDPKHPEGSFAALFRPVWYEGYPGPSHVWQSSFAGVEPEMKLGLWPLVFGTLKATFYSMAFGVPVALLAAIYTSEFMTPRAKSKIKPLIEMMASLPSVVLGFLAALVFAPVVETALPQILASIVTIPLAIVVGAAMWQLLPSAWVPYVTPWRLPLIIAVSGAGLACGIRCGQPLEQWLFAGNILRWLDGQVGSGAAGWLFLTLPASGLTVTLVCILLVNPWLRRRLGDWPRMSFGILNAAKIMAAILATGLLAWGAAQTLSAIGWDPRGSFVSTYVQRNALVVGFVMGFAIIPLIYTIADDALSTVPQHLRSASLGAGATPWQTAVRVVIPTAMSGLFSAVMIGLGRAVGETMIVLMAGGNTPVTDWNLFNGFRTLSANIAVELPEAVRDSTHFRTLFLAALTLFFLTFIVNTAAELVRIRFRRRALQL